MYYVTNREHNQYKISAVTLTSRTIAETNIATLGLKQQTTIVNTQLRIEIKSSNGDINNTPA